MKLPHPHRNSRVLCEFDPIFHQFDMYRHSTTANEKTIHIQSRIVKYDILMENYREIFNASFLVQFIQIKEFRWISMMFQSLIGSFVIHVPSTNHVYKKLVDI